MLKNNSQIIQIERIQKTVADFYKMPLAQMKKLDRKQPDSHQRQVAMFLARELTGAAYELIGKCFERDHTTIGHAVKSIKWQCGVNSALTAEIDSLKITLKPLLVPGMLGPLPTKS